MHLGTEDVLRSIAASCKAAAGVHVPIELQKRYEMPSAAVALAAVDEGRTGACTPLELQLGLCAAGAPLPCGCTLATQGSTASLCRRLAESRA